MFHSTSFLSIPFLEGCPLASLIMTIFKNQNFLSYLFEHSSSTKGCRDKQINSRTTLYQLTIYVCLSACIFCREIYKYEKYKSNIEMNSLIILYIYFWLRLIFEKRNVYAFIFLCSLFICRKVQKYVHFNTCF